MRRQPLVHAPFLILVALLAGCLRPLPAPPVWPPAPPIIVQPPIEPTTPPAVSALPRVTVEGRALRLPDGNRFAWRGITAFALLAQVAHGREGDAVALLEWARDHGVSVVRALAMKARSDGAPYGDFFALAPEEGAAALPRLLELAQRVRVYVHVVALADTTAYSFDHGAHVQALGEACAANPACVLLEVANEPYHPTQVAQVHDPAYLRQLRARVPPGVLVALGAAENDESDEMAAGADVVCVHVSRQDGERGWRPIRHAKEARDLSERVGKPALDSEPAKDTDAAHWRAKGLLARVLPLPGTYHYQGGLTATPPDGAALAAFQAWQEGLDALPAALEDAGRFVNAGWPGAPVKELDAPGFPDGTPDEWTVLRAYGTAIGGEAWSVLVGVTGTPWYRLGDGWVETSRREWPGAWLIRTRKE